MTLAVLRRSSVVALIFGLMLAGCAQEPQAPEPDEPQNNVFVGTIHTMNANNDVAEAVAVSAQGLILKVGTLEEALAAAGELPEKIALPEGQVLLPGFLDAHQHVIAVVLSNSGLMKLLGPCLPGPYESGSSDGCENYIVKSFQNLKDTIPNLQEDSDLFLLGGTLDPSRQPYDVGKTSEEFKQSPAKFIEDDLTPNRPVLILDQSGHFGYANHKAFDSLMAVLDPDCTATSTSCDNWPPTKNFSEGGEWNLTPGCTAQGPGDNSCYSGLLTEIEGYTPFFQAVGDSALKDALIHPVKYIEAVGQGVKETQDHYQNAGLTTIISMAQSEGELNATRKLAGLPNTATRMLSVVTPQVAQGDMVKSQPILAACDPLKDADCRWPKDLGTNGIKTIADGSTQGCTAALKHPVTYQSTSECTHPEGRIDFDSESDLENLLRPLWQLGTWRFETHANGNRAQEFVLNVYETLQKEKANPHTATLIHATVGDENTWKQAAALRETDGDRPALDVRFTHLIGHVAYWGDVFKRQLGLKNAKNIDATSLDQQYNIPFTFHSDGPVSIPEPLWYVQQAVTRTTWVYPELTESYVLGEKNKVTVLEALRAVTIRTAEEKELDAWIGSIEEGKVADFVRLDRDPLTTPPDEIASIQVINTYLGGEATRGGPDAH